MDDKDQPTSGRPRRSRRWRRIIAAGFGSIVLLSAILLVAVDAWRNWTLTREQTRLAAVLDVVEDELQQGMPAADYFRSRVRGRNGWEHIAPLYHALDAARSYRMESWRYTDGEEFVKSAEVLLGEAIEGLGDWSAASDSGESDTDVWLANSLPLADAFARAAMCDTVVPVALEGDKHWPGWNGTGSDSKRRIIRTAMARIRLLRESGDAAASEAELIAAATVWSRYRGLYLMDAMLGVAACTITMEYALEEYLLGNLSRNCAESIAALAPPDDDLLVEAILGVPVWIAYNARMSDWATKPPGWFDWLRHYQLPAGEGMFGSEFDPWGGGIKKSFVGPLNLTLDLRTALEDYVETSRRMETEDRWSVEGLKPTVDSLFSMSRAAPFMRRVSLRRLQHIQLELRLRMLENSRPLHEQRDAVERHVAEFPGVTLSWDDGVAVLGIEQELLDAVEAASELELEQRMLMAELYQAILSNRGDEPEEGPANERRIEPRLATSDSSE